MAPERTTDASTINPLQDAAPINMESIRFIYQAVTWGGPTRSVRPSLRRAVGGKAAGVRKAIGAAAEGSVGPRCLSQISTRGRAIRIACSVGQCSLPVSIALTVRQAIPACTATRAAALRDET